MKTQPAPAGKRSNYNPKKAPVLAAVLGLWLAAAPAAPAADLYGTITFKGTPPPEIPITPLIDDPNCGPLQTGTPTTHFYKVGPRGGFGDVVVSLAGSHGPSTGPTAPPLVIVQKGCEYSPYISACQTGQKIIVKNEDPVLHNIHVTPANPLNKQQNYAQLPHGPDLTMVFNAPEEFMRFNCDVHAWMFAYVSVFDHPFFSVSGANGAYRIRNVAPGRYTVVAAHRKAGTKQQEIEVGNQDAKLDFTFEAKPAE